VNDSKSKSDSKNKRESVRNIAKKEKCAEDTVVVDKPMYR